MENLVNILNTYLWSDLLVYLLLGTGLYLTFRMRFMQVRQIKEMLRLLLKGKSSEKGVSSFQALAMSISGRVGTGNIAGVASAIALGGPGAVFWMWVLAFLGASTAFAEAVLAQAYKEDLNGEYRGGPAYYISRGIGNKVYGSVFAFVCIISWAILSPGIQSNTITASINNAFGVQPTITAFVIIALLGLIIFGGVKRIGKVAQIVVPVMAIAYILVSLLVILANIGQLPDVIGLIFKSAFGFQPAFAGIVGTAISMGVKRGIYSNEAGMGTAPQSAAAAEVSHPAKQGLVQAFSVYIDTLFVCSATAFMILITNSYNVSGSDGTFLVQNLENIEVGPIYAQRAVESFIPSLGSGFVAISLLFFAFTTLLAMYYNSETNVAYLFRGRNSKLVINGLRIAFLIATFYGAIRTSALAWAWGDVGAGLTSWLNVIAVIILSGPAIKILKDYEEQKAAGIDPKFYPEKLGIKNAELWNEISGDDVEQKASNH